MKTIATIVFYGVVASALILVMAATLVSAGDCNDRGGYYVPTFMGLYGCVGASK